MEDYNFRFSETASINLYLIRFISAQLITIAHGVEGIGLFQLGDYIGSQALMFFFLISGLLVSYSTFGKIKKKNYDFKKYFLRRFSRIYPNLMLVLILIIFIDTFWIVFLGGKDLYNACNILTFIFTALFLNDSAIGYTAFCSARQLWPFPLFWWSYLFFGWLLLGKRTVKKKYIYYILLILFIFPLILVIMGYHIWIKIHYSLIWFLGVFFSYFINKMDLYIDKKSEFIMENQDKKENNIKKKIKVFCVANALILFILAYIRLYFHNDPFDTLYYLLLIGVIFCIIVFSQYTRISYPEKLKKGIIFMSNYSLTLYLLHFSIYNLLMEFLRKYLNYILVFFILFILVNLISLIVAYFTEMKADRIYYYLLKKFKLES